MTKLYYATVMQISETALLASYGLTVKAASSYSLSQLTTAYASQFLNEVKV